MTRKAKSSKRLLDPIPSMIVPQLMLSDRLKKIEEDYEGWSLLTDVFKIWDVNGDEVLSLSEVHSALNQYCEVENIIGITPDYIETLFDEVDMNHDRTLDIREFSIFMVTFADAMDTNLYQLACSMIQILVLGRGNYDSNNSFPISKRNNKTTSFFPSLRHVTSSKATVIQTPNEVYQLRQERDSLRMTIQEMEIKLQQRDSAIVSLEHALRMMSSQQCLEE
jgi:hypothetical protein